MFAELESQCDGDTEYTYALFVNHSTEEGVAMIITSEVNHDPSAARFGTHLLNYLPARSRDCLQPVMSGL